MSHGCTPPNTWSCGTEVRIINVDLDINTMCTCVTGRQFIVEVNASSLEEGVHYAEVHAVLYVPTCTYVCMYVHV